MKRKKQRESVKRGPVIDYLDFCIEAVPSCIQTGVESDMQMYLFYRQMVGQMKECLSDRFFDSNEIEKFCEKEYILRVKMFETDFKMCQQLTALLDAISADIVPYLESIEDYESCYNLRETRVGFDLK